MTITETPRLFSLELKIPVRIFYLWETSRISSSGEQYFRRSLRRVQVLQGGWNPEKLVMVNYSAMRRRFCEGSAERIMFMIQASQLDDSCLANISSFLGAPGKVNFWLPPYNHAWIAHMLSRACFCGSRWQWSEIFTVRWFYPSSTTNYRFIEVNILNTITQPYPHPGFFILIYAILIAG